MPKKYIVRLTQEERCHLHQTIKKLSGSSQKVRRAYILLKADANGSCRTDSRIAEAFNCRTKTVENIRQNFVLHGFKQTLNGKKRATSPTPKLLNGEQEAKIIATRLGPSPPGYGNWSLRLLARHVVESAIVPSISHETVRQTIKKQDEQPENPISGYSAETRCGICSRHGRSTGSL